MGSVVGSASADDLEWFVRMLNYQLEETPHWIKDENQLHDIQAWTRRVRTMATEFLHNKRVAARKRNVLTAAAWTVFIVLLGVVLKTLFA